jgi:hypothetical protein
MHRIATAAILASLGTEAAASGGLWCDAEDKKARIELAGGVTRGLGSPLFSFDGQARALDPSVPADLQMTQFGKDHVAQYWLDGEDLRLLLYQERAADKPHGSVQLTIKARASDEEGSYSGRYSLEVFDADASPEGKSWSFEGAISCGSE